MKKKQLLQTKERIREYIRDFAYLCYHSDDDEELFYNDLILLLEDEGLFDGQADKER